MSFSLFPATFINNMTAIDIAFNWPVNFNIKVNRKLIKKLKNSCYVYLINHLGGANPKPSK